MFFSYIYLIHELHFKQEFSLTIFDKKEKERDRNMSKKVKVVMYCSASKGPDDATYGNNGGKFWHLQDQSGVEIKFVPFGGFLEGQKLLDFLEECETADVVVTDAWNYSAYGTVESSQERMACIVHDVKASNPMVRVFSQLMGGDQRVAVHRYADPHQSYCDTEIVMAIKMCAQEREPGIRNVLVFDDNYRHAMAAIDQLSPQFNVMAVTSYDHAQALIAKEKFDIVLLDVLVPASARMMGREGEKFIGQEMPITPFLVFLAMKNGAKKIGLLTDAGHHDHPASACIDAFGGYPWSVGDVRIVLSNHDIIIADGVRVKNWLSLVDKLDRLD
jgi:CheY-like chemotaxis protein